MADHVFGTTPTRFDRAVENDETRSEEPVVLLLNGRSDRNRLSLTGDVCTHYRTADSKAVQEIIAPHPHYL